MISAIIAAIISAIITPIVEFFIKKIEKIIREKPTQNDGDESKIKKKKPIRGKIKTKKIRETRYIVIVRIISIFVSLNLILFTIRFLVCDDTEIYRYKIVTNGEYKVFIDENGYRPPPHFLNGDYNEDDPVINVSWHNAKKYCSYAGGRLFTEKEWRAFVVKEQAIWNLREWTATDTLRNCALTCDDSMAGSINRSRSYAHKSEINDKITFRCVFKK